MPTAQQQHAAALAALRIVADTVRELGSAPRGELYAALMAQGCSKAQFDQIEHILVNSGLCHRTAELLIWCGPSNNPADVAAL